MKHGMVMRGGCHVAATALFCALAALSGCRATPAVPAELQRCSDPRPQMCTYQYDPVCAQRDTGIRCVTTPCPASERRTYGNACGACSDPDVIGYEAGECR